MITCTNCAEALHPYIDRELSDEDVAQVRLHLDACPNCLHLYRFHESLHRLVRVRCQTTQAPPHLRERIEARLTQERLIVKTRPAPSRERFG